MELSLVIFRQIVIMFVYMAVGWFLRHKELITHEGSSSLSNLLLYVISPCVVVNSFTVEATPERDIAFMFSILAAVVVLILSIVLAHIVYRKDPVSDFGCAFSNAGFMGAPLVQSAFGIEGLMYGTGDMALMGVLQWTYGQNLLSNDKTRMSFKKIFLNHMVIAFLIGLLIYYCRIPVPGIAKECISSFSALNAPIAMGILGTYLGEIPFKSIFNERRIWLASFYRLIAIPLVTLAVLRIVFASHLDVARVLVVLASAPVGAGTAIYARRLDRDYQHAVKLVCFSTLCSVITMPLIIYLWEMIA